MLWSACLAKISQWQPPQAAEQPETVVATSFLSQLAESSYNFVQGGIAGGIGAFVSGEI